VDDEFIVKSNTTPTGCRCVNSSTAILLFGHRSFLRAPCNMFVVEYVIPVMIKFDSAFHFEKEFE